MSGLFIASKRVEHDGSRRAVVVAAFIGDRVRVRGPQEAAEVVTAALIAGRMKRELAEDEGRSS